MRKQHYMTWEERIKMETMLRCRVPAAQIARELGFCRQTIYNEIRRGTYMHTTDYRDEPRYSADKGEAIHRKAMQNRGRELKIGNDIEYANYLERKMLQDKYSPAAALAEARKAGFTTSLCVQTVYNYIDQGVFYAMTNNDLWEKPHRRKKAKKKQTRVIHPDLPSIEQRPEYIGERQEPGHWEMDLMLGKRGRQPVLLILVERVSREVIIRKIPDKKSASIIKALDDIEQKTQNFKERFKSITTDNGAEFNRYNSKFERYLWSHWQIRFRV